MGELRGPEPGARDLREMGALRARELCAIEGTRSAWAKTALGLTCFRSPRPPGILYASVRTRERLPLEAPTLRLVTRVEARKSP